ncbi:glycoside hydrolase family 9 protein [Lewinella sp. 4G2]|uniref:glycoside hydrolase family 9 protein n=1 Tax=Lewinella sp. 4G2 TaxID=1803372 RepID=UPI0007B4E496|nr:glycoside hydrolase family 9 protein [Lewinella sp. 4G2]OAV43445.1 hypothetical protein A3850_002565 [Lewinella sp. 4G2]
MQHQHHQSILRLSFFLLLSIFLGGTIYAQEVLEDRNFIRIDQFGYLPNATKVAVIAKAVDGYNAGEGIDLNQGATVDLIDATTNAVVFSAYPQLWNGGGKDDLSGDKGAWFDFTEFDTEGAYRIRVQKNDGSTAESYEFRIADDVYNEVMRAAINMFYYQRINQDKLAQYGSGEPWTDTEWYGRPNQETAVRELDNPSVTRDLSGGWFDAGDPNKYVTFAVDAVHALLTTYDNAPDFWNDFDLNIPESGNDTPDLLDEVKFEIDWIKKMQLYDPNRPTAGIIQKMGILNDVSYISPPSTDTRLRYYNGVCVSSTITGAGMMAHAAVSYKRANVWPEEIAELTDRAAKAFAYYEAAPNKAELCDDGRIEAGDADGPGNQYATEHRALAAAAAVYLFELTGEQKYKDFIAANYRQARPWKAEDWGVYRAHQGEALLYYTQNPEADPTTKQGILDMKSSAPKSTGSNYVVAEQDNLYRAKPIYFNWGSNSLISRQVGDIMDLHVYGIRPENSAAYTERGQSIINYLHGTNPSGICMLSNMYQYGGDLCADEMWHSWFSLDTKFDNIDGTNVGPAPGFISGGPNPQGQGSMPIKLGTHSFPATAGQQPDQKAFSVDNFWQNGPWAYNEPAIYYQAAYIKALSYFIAGNAAEGETGTGGIDPIKDCGEAELGFTVGNDVGGNGTVEMDSNSPGSTNGASVKLFDAGDAASYPFTISRGGKFDLAVRVRVGEAAGNATNLADAYTVSLDGNEVEYVLDSTSISPLAGDTYWGEIVLVDVALTAADHEVTVTAKQDYLKLDRVCWRDANSVPKPDTGGGSGEISFDCIEIENAFTILADVGGNGEIRGDGFTANASGDRYINMFDVGDKVSFPFSVADDGMHEMRFRLRVGEASGTDRNLADKYIVTLDGEEVITDLDEGTISALFDDTYWGEIVARVDGLSEGVHTVTVEANNNWLKFDRFCFGNADATSLFTPESRIAADIQVSPNPSNGLLQLNLGFQARGEALTIGLYDLTGRQLNQRAIRLGQASEHQFKLDYRDLNLAPGVYAIKLLAGVTALGEVQRIVIQ